MNHAAKQVEHLAKVGNMDAATQAIDILLREIDRLLVLKENEKLHTKTKPVY